MPFKTYLEKESFSNSGFSERIFQETEKTRLGKLVDQYVSGEKKTAFSDREKKAETIARNISEKYSEMLSISKFQVSIFGNIAYDIFSLPFKTRPDFYVPRVATIDLKITWESLKNIEALIKHMQYGRQCYFHRGMAGVEKSYLLFFSVKDGKSRLIESNENWDDYIIEKILIHGST